MSEENTARRSQRVQLACTPCRQGKLRCNRQVPACDQCFKRSRESQCTYSEKGMRYNAAHHESESMREKIERLEDFVTRLKNSNDAFTSSSNPTQGRINRTEQAGDVSALPGNLRLSESGGTFYIGPAHWESIIEDISEVKAYFQMENSPANLGSDTAGLDSSVSPADTFFGASESYSLDDLLAMIPPKAEMDRLVAAWFGGYDNLKCIIHAPTFQREYLIFWKDPLAFSPAWLALFFSIASLGAEISGQTGKIAEFFIRAEELRRLTVHALTLADYSNPQPYIIEALLHHTKSLLIKGHDVYPHIWLKLALVIRLCIIGGYHRDPSTYPAISPFNCEMRRRIWTLACEYDITVSYQLGLFSVDGLHKTDTALPSNIIDAEMRPDFVPEPKPWTEYTPLTYTIVFGRLVQIFSDVALSAHSTTSPTKPDIDSLYDKLIQTHDRIPQRLRLVPLDQCFTDGPEIIVERFRLEFLHLKAICILYRRYIDSEEHTEERERCLNAAEQTVLRQTELLEAGQPGGQLPKCMPFVSRHVHDLNFAAMLLCAELNGLPAGEILDPMSRVARTRPHMMRACEMWHQSGVVSPKARHALTAVSRFFLEDERFFGSAAVRQSSSDIVNGSDSAVTTGNCALHGSTGTHQINSMVPSSPDAAWSMPVGMPLQLSDPSGVTYMASGFEDYSTDPRFHDIFGPAYMGNDE